MSTPGGGDSAVGLSQSVDDNFGLPGGRRSRLGALIARQDGAIATGQLIEAGVGRGAIAHRRRAGRLQLMHKGVSLVGHVEGARAREIGAQLAVGGDCVVSHPSAAHLHALKGFDRRPVPVHVTVVGRKLAKRSDIHIHLARELPADERAKVGEVRVTSVARTILDVARSTSAPRLEELIGDAIGRRLCTKAGIERLLARYPGRPGTAIVRAMLETERGPKYTRSRAERLFLSLIREAGLPEPLVDVQHHGLEVDFLWPEHDFVVEIDGWAWHSSRPRFRNDRARDQHLISHGTGVMRADWTHVADERVKLIARVARTLGRIEGERRVRGEVK